jgi:crotonobetainyl-CoA:carnitine CoA-transferase CaiB-like acyl-CoA transferase
LALLTPAKVCQQNVLVITPSGDTMPATRVTATAMPNSWAQKLSKPRSAKRVQTVAPFAGIPAGSMLFVGTPDIIADYIRAIGPGETRMIERLRREIARKNDCDAMCPVSTAIFLRMIAEAAWDAIEAGAAVSSVVPFWRVIEPHSTIAKKLRVDSRWLEHQRDSEIQLKTGQVSND